MVLFTPTDKCYIWPCVLFCCYWFIFCFRFPNDPYIIEHIVKDIYVPNNEAEKLIDLLESRQSIFGADKLYDAANTWFNQNGRGTYEMLITMNLSALKFVPENLVSWIWRNELLCSSPPSDEATPIKGRVYPSYHARFQMYWFIKIVKHGIMWPTKGTLK